MSELTPETDSTGGENKKNLKKKKKLINLAILTFNLLRRVKFIIECFFNFTIVQMVKYHKLYLGFFQKQRLEIEDGESNSSEYSSSWYGSIHLKRLILAGTTC
jgi:hypothetical protein